MQAPKLPSLFKTSKHRRFDFKTRYYNEEQTRINKGQDMRLKKNNLKNTWGPSKRSQTNKKINKILFFAFLSLSLLTFLIFKA